MRMPLLAAFGAAFPAAPVAARITVIENVAVVDVDRAAIRTRARRPPGR